MVQELQEKWEVSQKLVRDQGEREEVLRGLAEGAGQLPAQPGGLPAQAEIGV